MPIALQVFLIVFLVLSITYLVFWIVRRHYRIQDFDINVEKLLDWINDTEITFFDKQNKDNKKQNIKKLAEQLKSFLLGDQILDEEGQEVMQ